MSYQGSKFPKPYLVTTRSVVTRLRGVIPSFLQPPLFPAVGMEIT